VKKKSELGPAWLGPARLVLAPAPLGLPWLGQLGLGPGLGLSSARLGQACLGRIGPLGLGPVRTKIGLSPQCVLDASFKIQCPHVRAEDSIEKLRIC
jgi:hypothetical protein